MRLLLNRAMALILIFSAVWGYSGREDTEQKQTCLQKGTSSESVCIGADIHRLNKVNIEENIHDHSTQLPQPELHSRRFTLSEPESKKRLLEYASSGYARDIIEQAKSYQTNFCLHPEQYRNPEFETNIKRKRINTRGVEFDMYVYSRGDFVSQDILGKGSWEIGYTEKIYESLNEHIIRKGLDKNNAIFMDIGANIGWYSLFMARLGYNVIAFEPAPKNVYILRKSLCLNPLMNVILITKGVGDQEMKCKIISHRVNIGDGITVCDNNTAIEKGYSVLGEIEIVKLDPFAKHFRNVRAIKMDIESYEPYAIKGGKEVFYNRNVQFILMEYQHKVIITRGTDPVELFKEIKKAGFEIRKGSFKGEIIDIVRMIKENKVPDVIDLFLVKQGAFNA